VAFSNEPILRVTAPITQAQFVESRIINLLNFAIMVASKAARCVVAASGKLLVDFGLRRAHGAEAGLHAARASYLAGFAGTATVLASCRYGIPAFGTMAHSYVQSHDSEESAFQAFAVSQPADVTFLIDTYDTIAAARKVVQLAPQLRERGVTIKAVRLDSGDLAAQARGVRRVLDEGGLPRVAIFCSGGIDEYVIRTTLAAGAPIDGFGIGTHLTTSADAPYLDSAYKLQEYAGMPRRKRSEGKATWPGRKQVYRIYDGEGYMVRDIVGLEDERREGCALLEPVMKEGKRLSASPSLETLRTRAAAELARLPPRLKALEDARDAFRVEISPDVVRLARAVDRRT
jgi:nicotinate phosphoribosyltransferase